LQHLYWLNGIWNIKVRCLLNSEKIDFYTPVSQSKAKDERNQAMENIMNENSCQLCAIEKLTFDPPPIYCTSCGVRIKRNAQFYTMGAGDTRHCFCIPCYNDVRGDSVSVDGLIFCKSRLEKRRNDEETEEAWVQCDKCEAWQHQICALFNGRRNEGGKAEYTCPNCYTSEIETSSSSSAYFSTFVVSGVSHSYIVLMDIVIYFFFYCC
jgi:hypothetical protein